MSIGSINDFDNEEPSMLPPPPEFPEGEFTAEEQAARMPPPRDPRPEPRLPPDPPPPRGWKPATAGELTDLSLLPNRFEQFASKTEQALEALADAFKTMNDRVLPLVVDHGKLIAELRRDRNAHSDLLAEHGSKLDAANERIDELELELTAANNRIAELETDVSTLRKQQLRDRQRASATRPTRNIRAKRKE